MHPKSLILSSILVSTNLTACPSPSSSDTYGPSESISCPADAISISPGATTIQTAVAAASTGATFCLGAGTYSITGAITPKTGQRFVGEFGAVIDGTSWSTSDRTQGAFRAWNEDIDKVTIRNLVIRHMPQAGIATIFGGADHWTIDSNRITDANTGLFLADAFTVTDNLIDHNRQYGFGGYRSTGVVFDHNEVAFNNTCQCHPADEGGAKFSRTTNNVIRNSYFHDNNGNNVWYDDGNTGALIENNVIVALNHHAVQMEINPPSTNRSRIRNNTITVLPTGNEGILISSSSSNDVSGNAIDYQRTRTGGIGAFAIVLFFDASRAGTDLLDNHVSSNTVRVHTTSSPHAAAFLCYLTADCSPYYTRKGNTFSSNAYVAPNLSGNYFQLGQFAVGWATWRSRGFDTSGTIRVG